MLLGIPDYKMKLNNRGICIVLLIVCVTCLLFWYVDPVSTVFVPKCPFKLLTGLSCPSCGTQRALHALLHGDVIAALRFNPFMLYSIPYVSCLVLTKYVLRGVAAERWHKRLVNRWLVWLYVVLFCLWWIVRNVWGW